MKFRHFGTFSRYFGQGCLRFGKVKIVLTARNWVLSRMFVFRAFVDVILVQNITLMRLVFIVHEPNAFSCGQKYHGILVGSDDLVINQSVLPLHHIFRKISIFGPGIVLTTRKWNA